MMAFVHSLRAWIRMSWWTRSIAPIVLAALSACSPAAVAPLSDQSLLVEAPEWQPGDEWVFRIEHGFKRGQLTVRVTEAGPGGYVLSSLEDREEWYWQPGFRLLGIVQDGEIVGQFLPAIPVFKFPMQVGATWSQGEGEAASSGET